MFYSDSLKKFNILQVFQGIHGTVMSVFNHWVFELVSGTLVVFLLKDTYSFPRVGCMISSAFLKG